MSIVSAEVKDGNPITDQDVLDAAATLGFQVKPEEVSVHRTLLASAFETFEELLALPEYHPPVDTDKYPRRNVRKVGRAENVYGNAWAYCFDLQRVSEPQNGTTRSDFKHSELLRDQTIVLKDNICVAGVPQSNGTDAIEPWTPHSDATIVTRILDAGGHIVGTGTCEALSCATVSNTASEGPVYNPWAEGYSAGGSSSGVAALVGGSIVTMGVGADQGGSIRVPAAFCGLVGLKPTHGLVPYTGVTACEAILDHVGPICKTVMDTASLLEAMAGRDGIDDRQIGAHDAGADAYTSNLLSWHKELQDTSKPLAGRKAVILTEAINLPFVKEEMKSIVRAAAEQFRDLGAEVDEISMPSHPHGCSLWMAICRQSLTGVALGYPMGRRCYHPTGFGESLLPWTQEKWDKLPIAMRNEMLNGVFEQKRYPNLYQKCTNLAIKLKQEYDTILAKYDVLLLPSVPFTAPPLFDRATASPWEVVSSTFGQTLNTMQFNLTGHPAMSLPTGFASDMSGIDSNVKLPVGVQLVGPMLGESKVLEFGYAYEQVYDWKMRNFG